MATPLVLVAEDEMIVAFDLCETVAEAGYEVQGPHADISSAMLSIQKRKPDIAILDIDLKDGASFPLAESLAEENIPVIFHSGQCTASEVQDRFPHAFACAKPCPPSEILEAVQKALSTH